MQKTEYFMIDYTLAKLDDRSEPVRAVVSDLIRSGFHDLDELVKLTQIAKESILPGRESNR